MEEWKDIDWIPDLQSVYAVSSLGRVRNADTGKVLAQGLDLFGYPTVQIITTVRNAKSGRNVRKTLKVHRLMALAFIPNPENKPTVNHKNGVKTNNSLDNLEWYTRHEQLQHAYDLGLKVPARGVSNVNAKLTEDQVREIRRLYKKGDKSGYGAGKLGQRYDVHESTILNIVNGRTYKNVK